MFLIQFYQKTYLKKLVKNFLILGNKLYIFFYNELSNEKISLDDYNCIHLKTKKLECYNPSELDDNTSNNILPFYINETVKQTYFEKIQNFFREKCKYFPIIGEGKIVSRLFNILNNKNECLTIGIFRRKSDFYLKKQMKIFYIYLFPYAVIFYKLFVSKIIVRN